MNSYIHHRRRRLAALGVLAAVAWAQVSAAQAPKPATPPRDAEIVTTVGDLDFAAEPLRIESVGLSMRIPVGATVTTTQAGSLVRASIRDAKRNWIINVETPQTENPLVTVEEAAHKTLMARMMTDKVIDAGSGKVVASMGRVLDQVKRLRVPGCQAPGERFYVSIPQGPTERLVQGYTIFKVSDRQFIAFELICAEALYPQARRVYESAIATLRVEDPASLDARRRASVAAGLAFFDRLTPADYDRAIASPPALFRLSKPATSGSPSDAEEQGWRFTRFFKGVRAEIDPRSTDTRPGPANPAGYLCEIKARLLDRLPTGDHAVTDVQAIYFMSEHRREEAWSVKMARQDKPARPPVIFTETGTRSGTNMTVIINRPGVTDPTLHPTVPPEGYISQFEAFLLPRLLATVKTEVEVGAYAYNWTTQNVSLRRDAATRDPAMPGVWLVTTTAREGAEPTTTLLRDTGEVISATLNDGVLMEPAWPDELERLWKSKGLPVERMVLPLPERRR